MICKMELSNFNLDKWDMCRVCLTAGANNSIFNCSSNNVSLCVKMKTCTNVEVEENDGLPAVLCLPCIQNLTLSYNFKLQCEATDSKLRTLLSKNDIKNDIPSPNLKLENIDWPCHEELNIDGPMIECVTFITQDLLDTDVKFENTDSPMKEESIETVSITTNKITKNKNHVLRCTINKKTNNRKCEFCNKNLKTNKALTRHLLKCSSDPSQVNCTICHKKFKDKYILSRHMGSLHDTNNDNALSKKPKRHMCDMCGHTFHDPYGLNMHKRSHTGSRPYICTICGCGFSQLSNMERHIKAKHNNERPFQCDICSKVFAYSYVLTEHLKTHTGEKDFECSVCERKFAKKFALNRHMLTHTLERPYKCKLCEKAYAQSNDLKAHNRRAHEKLDIKSKNSNYTLDPLISMS